MSRKRFTAGEIRFRTAPTDQQRLDWLLDNHPDPSINQNLSALIRLLILREYERLQPKTTTEI